MNFSVLIVSIALLFTVGIMSAMSQIVAVFPLSWVSAANEWGECPANET